MAEVFMSHSRGDPAQRDWLRSLFGDTRVRAICKEFDDYRTPPWADIMADIQRANAVFLLLTPAVLSSSHTVNWVSFEAATALNLSKPLWVFEEAEQPTHFPIPGIHLPFARYLPFSRGMVGLDDYVRRIIRGYEDPDWLSALGFGAGVAALSARMASDPSRGALVGGLLAGGGKLLSSLPQPPRQPPVQCPYPNCRVQFELHAAVSAFYCPSCRQAMQVQMPTE